MPLSDCRGRFPPNGEKRGAGEGRGGGFGGNQQLARGAIPRFAGCRNGFENGVDISSLRARKVVRDDFQHFDLIIALDTSHLQVLEKLRRESAQGKAELKLLMRDYAPETGFTDVPDPYYGGYDGFQSVFELIRGACANLLSSVREKV